MTLKVLAEEVCRECGFTEREVELSGMFADGMMGGGEVEDTELSPAEEDYFRAYFKRLLTDREFLKEEHRQIVEYYNRHN
jgi:hypothetical protein